MIESIRGTIRAIEMHDINKARGHHTYNVELLVDRGQGDPLRVRVAKIYWGRVAPELQGILAPAGPKPLLRPRRYHSWAVGDAVRLTVEMTSPTLALLRR